jgi:hypothetical protein
MRPCLVTLLLGSNLGGRNKVVMADMHEVVVWPGCGDRATVNELPVTLDG